MVERQGRVAVYVVPDAVARKHLQGYLNEYAWRYNNCAGTGTRSQFELLLVRAASGR